MHFGMPEHLVGRQGGPLFGEGVGVGGEGRTYKGMEMLFTRGVRRQGFALLAEFQEGSFQKQDVHGDFLFCALEFQFLDE